MNLTTDFALGLAVAFAVTTLLVPLSVKPARRLGLIDHPDYRKHHDQPTPLTGGICIVVGLFAGLAVVAVPMDAMWTLTTGVMLLLAVGVVDDMVELPAAGRFSVQIGVACLMVFGGDLQIQSLGPVFGPAYGPVGLGPLAAPFTIACVVFMINAINMADGLDGLAGGISFIILVLLSLSAWLDGAGPALVAVPALLALSTSGFLVHNLRIPGRTHARAFLGDTGSMLLGYAISWLAIALGTRGGTIYPISIAWLLVVPGMDTLALFFRRLRLGRSPFSADRSHLHHILRRSGYGVGATVTVIYAMVFASGVIGLAGWLLRWPEWLLFAGATAVLLGYQVVLANAHRIVRWHLRRARYKQLQARRAVPPQQRPGR